MSERDDPRGRSRPVETIAPVANRRGVLKAAGGLAAFAAALGVAPRLSPTAAAQGTAASDPATRGLARPKATGTQLVMLGTRGGPGVGLKRAETSSLVMVDDTPYLIDCGYDTLRDLVAAGIGFLGIDNVFFTHLHDDHTADVPALLTLQWTGQRKKPTNLYGPYGTEAMVKGALAFFKANTEIRIVDEGRKVRPEELFHGHDIEATSKPIQAFKDDKVTVTTIENAHFPKRSTDRMPYRSIAIRFDTKDRSIVFSGDTAYTKNIVDLAQNADVYVSEVMAELGVRPDAEARCGRSREGQCRQHVPPCRRHAFEAAGCRPHCPRGQGQDRGAESPHPGIRHARRVERVGVGLHRWRA